MKILRISNTSKEGTLLPSWDGWLKERFGDCCAQLSIQTTLKLKNAVKDVARAVLGQVPRDIEDLAKRFEMPPQGLNDGKFILGYEDDEGVHQGSIERDEALIAYINKYPKQWEIVKKALTLPRQMSRHASAFVVASKPISDFIPITSVSGIKVTAFSGPEVEAVGGLKMDWLTVLCINDIQACLDIIKERRSILLEDKTINGIKVPAHRLVLNPNNKELVDIWDLPSDDKVFEDISSGKTETVFQFSTPSAVQWIKHFNYKRPDGSPGINSILSMAAFTALDRPGPLNFEVAHPDIPTQKHNVLVEYSRRIRGLKGSNDIFPIFDRLLPETNSMLIFQEQLQKVYQYLTGCTGGEAEEFRSFSAKKKPEKMAKAYTFFIEKASEKIGKDQAEQVWQSLVAFSAYSFNKSHAVSYVIISYACAWLKHHYPLEWWCSVLKNAKKNEVSEKFWPYIRESVDYPDLNLSKPTWAIVGDRIRAPIDLCLGIGESAHNQLSKHAPYSSLDDFCQKIVQYRIDNANAEGKWAKSSITAGTVYIMIVAGIMESFFDPLLSVSEKLDVFQDTLKRHVKEKGGTYSKSKVEHPTLDALGRYQIKKKILPVYSDDIRQYLQESDRLFKLNGSFYYKYKVWSRVEGIETDTVDRIIGLSELTGIDASLEMPQGGYRCVTVGYIEDKNTFSYLDKNKKTKTAKKFLIDCCGFKREMVYWPDDKGSFPVHVENIQEGSIVICVLVKTKIKQGFSIKETETIRKPPKKDNGSENDQSYS